MKKNLRGFTLIELLVVVAIIGLLASFIVVNVQKIRFQAYDAQIQSYLHQLRNAAEMSYTRNEHYDEVCNDLDNTVSDSGEFGAIEKAIRDDNGNQSVTCFESSDKRDFVASSPLRAKSGKHWCIESAGLSIELDNQITGPRCQ